MAGMIPRLQDVRSAIDEAAVKPDPLISRSSIPRTNHCLCAIGDLELIENARDMIPDCLQTHGQLFSYFGIGVTAGAAGEYFPFTVGQFRVCR